uniref:RING-type domain-containing protein n=1 Tax=Fibrocapsa japonica TaxID=94617 RepID=A0A7S2XXC2_9STRA|mmetsp:Transcript_21730/g.31525  ORF Transcript_21730/g.31525 Transcript_21730/m.31525 type:complete len:189 (+) Transcript_21730:26-592(+)
MEQQVWEAARIGDADTVARLVAQHPCDRLKRTALMKAAFRGHTEVVQKLIAARANLNMQNKNKSTALHLACWKGHSEVVQVLVEAGADTTLRDKRNRTALKAAEVHQKIECARILRDAPQIQAQALPLIEATCCICLTDPVVNVLVPCGHMCVCDRNECKRCVDPHRNAAATCPIDRTPVERVQRVYV